MNYLLLFLAYVLVVAPEEASSFSSSSVGRGRIVSLTPYSISTSTPYQYKSSCLSSSTNGEDGDINSDKKIDGRKNRVIIGYKAMMCRFTIYCKSRIDSFNFAYDWWIYCHASRGIIHHERSINK